MRQLFTPEEMLSEAYNVIAEHGYASVSLLQRRLKIGYARACEIVELLEKKGLVGTENGSKPREILTPTQPEDE